MQAGLSRLPPLWSLSRFLNRPPSAALSPSFRPSLSPLPLQGARLHPRTALRAILLRVNRSHPVDIYGSSARAWLHWSALELYLRLGIPSLITLGPKQRRQRKPCRRYTPALTALRFIHRGNAWSIKKLSVTRKYFP